MSSESRKFSTDLSEVIAENFGANATYVETLLARWRSDPSLVDESWRAYFEELIGSNGDAATAPAQAATVDKAATADGAAVRPAREPAIKTKAGPQPKTAEPELKTAATPIRGAALKIVENMDASLAVPTATSQRRIPVKLLDENRRLINRHLQESDRRKASYTHLIAYALLRALESFPRINDGFEVIDDQPSRIKRHEVNLGIAIDLEKKD